MKPMKTEMCSKSISISKFQAKSVERKYDSTDSSSDNESAGIEMTGDSSELRKLLECPICFNLILPPITLCINGHSICNMCREQLQNCPVCRCQFTQVRNLFAEKFLQKCTITCTYKMSGCKTTLQGWELAAHQNSCNFRGLGCPECAREIPYHQFLHHLRVEEKLEMANAVEVVTGFEIDNENDINPVWEPIWIHCHDRDFFCFLNKRDSLWLIWIGVLGLANDCEGFVSSITIWNDNNHTEREFVGDIHPLRSKLENVRNSEQCLILEDYDLKNFIYEGGIDIHIRIDRTFQVPMEDKGTRQFTA